MLVRGTKGSYLGSLKAFCHLFLSFHGSLKVSTAVFPVNSETCGVCCTAPVCVRSETLALSHLTSFGGR